MSNTIYTDAMRDKGAADAADFQARSASMTGTEMYAEEEKIPDFQAAKALMNMLQRPVGFVCKSSAGRVVKLLQVYDSTVYTQEPEELPAQWGFKWSTDPAKALPFVSISTSPYMTGDCCIWEGKIYRSNHDNNVWSPTEYLTYWDEVQEGDGPLEPSEEPDEPSTEPEQPEEGGNDDDPSADVPDFVQPTGAHDAYNVGDRVKYNGHVYESLITGNTYSPEAYPQGWKMLA